MAGSKGKGSGVSKTVKSAQQQERLAAALRENLRRRKVRAQARHATDVPEAPNPPPESPKKAVKPG